MSLRKHSLVMLVLLALMGQGLMFLHDLQHLSAEDSADCLLCLKLEKQKNLIAAQSLSIKTISDDRMLPPGAVVSPSTTLLGPRLARAPPQLI